MESAPRLDLFLEREPKLKSVERAEQLAEVIRQRSLMAHASDP